MPKVVVVDELVGLMRKVIEVIDGNGIVQVEVKEKLTGLKNVVIVDGTKRNNLLGDVEQANNKLTKVVGTVSNISVHVYRVKDYFDEQESDSVVVDVWLKNPVTKILVGFVNREMVKPTGEASGHCRGIKGQATLEKVGVFDETVETSKVIEVIIGVGQKPVDEDENFKQPTKDGVFNIKDLGNPIEVGIFVEVGNGEVDEHNGIVHHATDVNVAI